MLLNNVMALQTTLFIELKQTYCCTSTYEINKQW